MYMRRNVSKYLERWKADKYRKPLVVQGARQVGKTYAILEFGKTNYDSVAYFNFETDKKLATTFEENISPSYLLPILSHISGQKIAKESTLVVFDEIQLCERALTSLKYFCEQAPEYHVVAAGSLLGVAVNRKKNAFPVGKIDRYTMFSMDMEEFLRACGEDDLVERIRACYGSDEPMPAALHDAALNRYRQYLAVGGLPEVVARFVDTNDYTQVRHVQETIQADYLDDMSKYQESANEIKKTRLTYDTIAVQLSKKNARFQYKIVKTGARAAEYENAIEWLASANLISQVYRVEQIAKPLENYKDIDDFKVYLSDMGLLCAQKGVRAEDVFFMEDELTDFKGGMTENYVDAQLIRSGLKPYFWRNAKGTSEVDFVVNLGGKLVPIEVKSGGRTRSTSLNEYVKLFNPAWSIRVSEKNFGFDANIKSVPLYAVFCIRDS
ncbi:MAG: ATP-binding protein [Thermoguttaceae bacterium]|nr:ATP-binding protein [Thermoguttaceae bacterium]